MECKNERTKGKLTPFCQSHHASRMIASLCVRTNHDQLFDLHKHAVCFGFSLDCDWYLLPRRTCVAKDGNIAYCTWPKCQPVVHPPTKQEWWDTVNGWEAICEYWVTAYCIRWEHVKKLKTMLMVTYDVQMDRFKLERIITAPFISLFFFSGTPEVLL